MFDVKLPVMLHLCLVACRLTIFDAIADICAGIDVAAKVMREGLIDLLVAVAALTSLGSWRAAVVA